MKTIIFLAMLTTCTFGGSSSSKRKVPHSKEAESSSATKPSSPTHQNSTEPSTPPEQNSSEPSTQPEQNSSEPSTQPEQNPSGSNENGIKVKAQGMGKYSGLEFCVPAHTKAKIKVNTDICAVPSEEIKKVTDYIKSLMTETQKENLEKYESEHSTGDLSIWSVFSLGKDASYDEINQKMKSMGLSDEQITKIHEMLETAVHQTTEVAMEYKIDNRNFDYETCGSIYLWTIEGQLRSQKNQTQFRLLAGSGFSGQAPATGSVIPKLNYPATERNHDDTLIHSGHPHEESRMKHIFSDK